FAAAGIGLKSATVPGRGSVERYSLPGGWYWWAERFDLAEQYASIISVCVMLGGPFPFSRKSRQLIDRRISAEVGSHLMKKWLFGDVDLVNMSLGSLMRPALTPRR